MSNLDDIQLSVRSSLPEMLLLGFLASSEIAAQGFAVVLGRMGKRQQVVGYTLGLSELGHPEIVNVGGEEDDVFGLLTYLATQVVEHGQVFSEGTHDTTLFSELVFCDHVEEPHNLPLMELVLGGTPVTALFCTVPKDFTVIQQRPAHQDLRRIA
ncbi:DUF4262 domain-containing protein [Glutamicibacter arilaitensis]|uniref:DUF4262 domain-containing protein n=1 Tax=Glutamicibacter arilaitensis TaxID=256701 RepID=UPI003A95BDDB